MPKDGGRSNFPDTAPFHRRGTEGGGKRGGGGGGGGSDSRSPESDSGEQRGLGKSGDEVEMAEVAEPQSGAFAVATDRPFRAMKKLTLNPKWSFQILVEEPLNDRVLQQQVMPVISAMFAINRILGGGLPTPQQLRVHSITQHSPVTVGMQGAGELYKEIAKDVIPWRRTHEKALAHLKETTSIAELERKRAEVLEAERKGAREEAEAAAARERARAARAEADRIELKLAEERFNLAISMANRFYPGASPAEQFRLVSQLMPELVKLTSPNSPLALNEPATSVQASDSPAEPTT